MLATIGLLFISLGLVMIFDVRGWGTRAIALMVALGTAFGADTQGRKIAAHKRLFRTGWGTMALSFGIATLLIVALH